MSGIDLSFFNQPYVPESKIKEMLSLCAFGKSKLITSVGGTANAITGTVDGLTAYEAGQIFILIPTADNSLSVTINLNSLGNKDIYSTRGDSLVEKNLKSGQAYLIIYNGTRFNMINEAEERIAYTPGNLVPSAGSVTAGTKAGFFQFFGDLCYFEMQFEGWTQNSATAATYNIPLPVTRIGTLTHVPVFGYDANTGLMLTRATSNSTTNIIIGRSGGWAAAAAVNVYMNGQIFIR